ncbi:BrnT family toxin [Methylobacterium bullatum]|uniref:BrnT family toxin n=1 Tax=Methylobacterium bullatum TaxID=570505 RepID=UPI0030CBDAE0
MAITFDPVKRDRALAERGLDFDAAADVFAGRVLQFEDNRQDYGEVRLVSVGELAGRMVVIVWTPRGADRHIISMRKANDREQAKYAPLLR